MNEIDKIKSLLNIVVNELAKLSKEEKTLDRDRRTSFRLKIFVEAPTGGRKGTVLKLIAKMMEAYPNTFNVIEFIEEDKCLKSPALYIDYIEMSRNEMMEILVKK